MRRPHQGTDLNRDMKTSEIESAIPCLEMIAADLAGNESAMGLLLEHREILRARWTEKPVQLHCIGVEVEDWDDTPYAVFTDGTDFWTWDDDDQPSDTMCKCSYSGWWTVSDLEWSLGLA